MVNGQQLVDGLDFDPNLVVDDQISAKAYFEFYVVIDDWSFEPPRDGLACSIHRQDTFHTPIRANQTQALCARESLIR
jgi:hypothetical protein